MEEKAEYIRNHKVIVVTGMYISGLEDLGIDQRILDKTAKPDCVLPSRLTADLLCAYTKCISHTMMWHIQKVAKQCNIKFGYLSVTNYDLVVNLLYDLLNEKTKNEVK